VVVAAGRGARFGGYKQLVPLRRDPLLVHTLSAFSSCQFAECVVVLPHDFLLQGTWDRLVAEFPALVGWRAVEGREERALSVLEGVTSLTKQSPFVAVHDGARPLPPLDATASCLHLLRTNEELAAAIVAAPVTDTLKRIEAGGPGIARTEDRSQFVRAETPQVCRRSPLLAALSEPSAATARDEAQALEFLGRRTAFILHTGQNPKVTHASDVAVVNALLESRSDTTPEPRPAKRKVSP
jgi:2-C-methyl-D-erythritol 4-phosphate cytidylyltransferase